MNFVIEKGELCYRNVIRGIPRTNKENLGRKIYPFLNSLLTMLKKFTTTKLEILSLL